MKIRWRTGILFFLNILFLSACVQATEDTVRNRDLYLAAGNRIYMLPENEELDYKTIHTEIGKGNAGKVKEEYEAQASLQKDPETQFAMQNVLGITEAYSGEYELAYERFRKLIDRTEKSDGSEKEELLLVFYNNIGVVSTYLQDRETEEDWLKKAEELCKDSYTRGVIRLNRENHMIGTFPKKQWGVMMKEMKKIMKNVEKPDKEPDFVFYIAVLNMADGFTVTDQEKRAIRLLDKYMDTIPDTPEYYLIKAAFLERRGYGYYRLGELVQAIDDGEKAVSLAQNTVDENSQELAMLYKRLVQSYQGPGNSYEIVLKYLQKMVPGYRYKSEKEKGNLYYEMGVGHEMLGEEDNAKTCFLKSYTYYSLYESGIPFDRETYTQYGSSYFPRQWLYGIYNAEGDASMDFGQWLSKELQEVDIKEDDPGESQ